MGLNLFFIFWVGKNWFDLGISPLFFCLMVGNQSVPMQMFLKFSSWLPICARLTGPLIPPLTGKFFGARFCKVTFKHLPQPVKSHIPSFGTLGQLFKICPFSGQKSHSAGGRGDPRFIFLVGILIFFYLGAHAKFQIPKTIPSVRKGSEGGGERVGGKNH